MVNSMNDRQQLFSEFFGTMIRVRKILDQAFGLSGENKVSSMLQMQALEHIQQNSKITAGELASHLHMSSSALTQLTDRMIDAELISREHCLSDRRSVCLSLTSSGKKQFRERMKLIKTETSKILEPISDKDLSQIVRIFSDFLVQHEVNASDKA